jgi:hypothetical protein
LIAEQFRRFLVENDRPLGFTATSGSSFLPPRVRCGLNIVNENSTFFTP